MSKFISQITSKYNVTAASSDEVASKFLDFMEVFIGSNITPEDFVEGIFHVWKVEDKAKALKMLRTYTHAEFPALLALLRKVSTT
jgi:hypothetical protein